MVGTYITDKRAVSDRALLILIVCSVASLAVIVSYTTTTPHDELTAAGCDTFGKNKTTGEPYPIMDHEILLDGTDIYYNCPNTLHVFEHDEIDNATRLAEQIRSDNVTRNT
jgi:hypothetical protein